jgi:hypothetical protein
VTREEKEQWDIFMRIWVIPALKNTWGEKKCKEIVEALEEWEEQGTVLDEIRSEIEETYMNITYQENKNRKAAWGLRKALEIIDKYRAESEEV